LQPLAELSGELPTG